MKTLYLIRHSITEGNQRRLYYGATDLPLIEEGRELCHSLRGSFNLPQDIRYATSGMLRTEETLKELFGDVPHEVFSEMREAGMGIFEMRSYDQLKDTEEYQAWLADATGEYVIPGGESNRGVFQRVSNCVQKIAETYEGSILIVCHGGVIGCAMSYLFPNERNFYEWIRGACQGYAIHFNENRPVSYENI